MTGRLTSHLVANLPYQAKPLGVGVRPLAISTELTLNRCLYTYLIQLGGENANNKSMEGFDLFVLVQFQKVY